MKNLKKFAAITLIAMATSSTAFAYNGTGIYNTGYSPVFQEAFEAH